MIGPVQSPIHVASEHLYVLSVTFRLYVGLSRDGSYLHVIAPRQVELTDIDGHVVAPVGTLACNCKGATFHGHCYRLAQAEAFERGDAAEVAWFGLPPVVGQIAPETELERAAARG